MGHRWRGRSIIFVHHEGRGKRPRGTSKKEDVLDTMIGLKRAASRGVEDSAKNESTFELEFTKAREFYGRDAAPMVLHLSTASGSVEWNYEHAADDLRTRVAKKVKAGYKGRDIAKELGITEGRVSQIRREIASAGGL
jgi:putative DNA primase/helicase